MEIKMVIRVNTKKDFEYYAKLPYTIILEQWDDGQGPYWVARVAELPHCIIHGDTKEEAIGQIEDVKVEWIKSNLARGLPIPEPTPREFSGQIRLRITPSLHKLLSLRAATEGMSLNYYMATSLAQIAGFVVQKNTQKLRKQKVAAKK
jgi:antitoxin HicB